MTNTADGSRLAAHTAKEKEGRSLLAMHLGDLILGGQDGLVNVLGLVLGLSAAGSDSRVIIIGGLAALLSESIAMAGVAYTSGAADRDYYLAELERERREIVELPDVERAEVRKIFSDRGLTGDVLNRAVEHLTADPELWVQVMMRDELGLVEPPRENLLLRGALVGISAAVGSLIPLFGYFVLPPMAASILAVVLAAFVLFGTGVYKARTLVGDWKRSGFQMLAIGMVSALAGYLIGVLLRPPG